MADQKARRAAVAKALKAAGVKQRKGHWRLPGAEVVWYVDLRAEGPAPAAPMRFEVGAWPVSFGPEPDGGAVDCALLMDVPLGEDPAGEAGALLDRLTALGTIAALRQADLPGALLDAGLRELLT
ncbi:hypothetical protein [Nocardioides sp.]|uniref:hypothetical protein n=1 Tax=Nocardioides sp. TaxID=35761 RepID=UPI0039E6779D